jgi:tungstate transport system ATP-binding protein
MPVEAGPPAAFAVRDLRVRRGRSFTLEVPALSLGAGRTLAVLGLNGAGKSTLLEVLALLLSPDEGEVVVLGGATDRAAARRRLRRRLSLALQDPLLLAGSVLDNVALPLRLRGMPADLRRARAARSLARFGVAHLAGRPSRGLSGGEARRVSLARALATDPDLLLLDEPFSALDPPTREALLRDFQKAVPPGTAVVLVTHDRVEALGLGHDVAVLQAGRLLQWGPAQEVFRSPRDPETAALVGLETILTGRVVSTEGGVARVEVAPGILVEAADEAVPGDLVTLCIHPEEVRVDLPAPGTRTSARNVFAATVRALAPHGSGRRVTLEAPFPIVAVVTRHSVDDLGLVAGAGVSVSFKASAVRLFPARERPG